MKLSKLASFVSLLGLMVASTVESKAANPPDLNTGTILFALNSIEQAKDYVEAPAGRFTSTVKISAVGNAQIIQFIGDLMEVTFSAKSVFVVTNDYIYVKDGTNALVDVSDFFNEDSFCWDLYSGVNIEATNYESWNFTSYWISSFNIEAPCMTGESVSGSSSYLNFYGVTTEVSTALDNYLKDLDTSSGSQTTTGYGYGRVDGDNIIIRGSVIRTWNYRHTYD